MEVHAQCSVAQEFTFSSIHGTHLNILMIPQILRIHSVDKAACDAPSGLLWQNTRSWQLTQNRNTLLTALEGKSRRSKVSEDSHDGAVSARENQYYISYGKGKEKGSFSLRC